MNPAVPSAQAGGAGPQDQFRFREQAKLPAIRKELKITAVSFRGHVAYVVKDPASLKYYRWGEKERFLASLLDGKKTGQQVLTEMQQRFADSNYQSRDLELVITQFIGAGLLLVDGTVAQQIYHRQRRAMKKAKRSKLWLTILSKLVSFKITLFDPDLLLLRLSRYTAFFWTRKGVGLLLGLMAAALWVLSRDTGSLASRTPNVFGWENLFILWVVMILVKVVHEFGHGLSCKHFGGEVHEMGALFILFSPFLFCDATDSWVFKEKWKRMVVNFGGIYLELFLACIAAMLWALTTPGIFNQVCFNVMFVCSMMTAFFNANPLMKFDGYYAFSDWLEVPNLKERGDRALISGVTGFFTGGVGVGTDPIVDQFKWPILIYAVASYTWTFTMAYRILRSLGKMLEPAGLDRIAQTAEAIVLCGGIVMPPIIVGLQVMKVIKADPSGQTRKHLVGKLAIVILALIVFFSIPAPFNIRSACVMDGSNRIRVTAAASGFVNKIAVKDGQSVNANQVLAMIQNPELEVNAKKINLQLEASRIQEGAAISKQLDQEISSLRSLTCELETVQGKLSKDLDSLTLRSPQTGTVIGSDLALKQGILLRKGDLLCEILPEGPLQAVIVLLEKEAALVKKGQVVSFRLQSLPGVTYHGEVLDISAAPSAEFPHQSLSEYAGGTVPSLLSAPSLKQSDTPVALPTGIIYKARVAVENPSGSLRAGMSGILKIQCGYRPLGSLLVQWVRNMIRSDFQL